MTKQLPENATADSRRLHDFAARLAAACPQSLGAEIALVGSAAMGMSDAQSDLDINLWVPTLPPEAERVAWLTSLGATDFNVQPPRQDRSYGIGCVIDGVDVGCSWQTFATLDFVVELLEQGIMELGDSVVLYTLVDVLVQAVPLRTAGKIDAVQARLSRYPERLRERLIAQTAAAVSSQIKTLPKHIRYGNVLEIAFHASLIGSRVIHLLYPINRRWSPQAKWEYRLARDLPLQPPDLYARLEQVLRDPDIVERSRIAARLARDTLTLVKDEYDLADALATLEDYSGASNLPL